MQTKLSEVTLTIIITTILLLLLGSLLVYFLFLYQRKRYRHKQELLELRESFNQNLLQSKLEIQEQTLDHIAKELHANFSHLVSVININLSTLIPDRPEELKLKVAETKSLAKQLMAELKVLSVSLNTDHIMQVGFIKALENELNRLDRTGQYNVTLTKTGHDYWLKPENEIILFRMCQETLNNIVKHADAKAIKVWLDYSPDNFKLVFNDDGKGFNVVEILERYSDNESTGLRNIKIRSKLINAKLIIESEPGKGTTTSISIPATD
jgi:signal transduction histidine kinase